MLRAMWGMAPLVFLALIVGGAAMHSLVCDARQELRRLDVRGRGDGNA